MTEKNQIRVLCKNCGCYYYFDVKFEFKDYSKAINQTPLEARKKCPECQSQQAAKLAHHSADHFNAESKLGDRPPRYCSGPGSIFEPIKVK